MWKKTTAACIGIAAAAALTGSALAAVSGVCSNCHTMHNSQGGEPMATMGTSGAWDAQSALLKGTCLGCHTTSDGDPLSQGYPRVRDTGDQFDDDNSLAGGFFQPNQSSGSHDDKAHSLGNTATPVGYESSEEPGLGTDWYTGDSGASPIGLGCAGTNGCHGCLNGETDCTEDDMRAISGGHHSGSGAYRMLYVSGDPVQGAPASDYEKALITNPSLDDAHNIYSASTTDPSISELCGKCHSNFHGTGDTNGSSPFVRHPTDVSIPDDWEIVTDFSDQWTSRPAAWKNHPLGFTSVTAGGQTAANAQVTCLSCHRAHGTAHNDLLRWDYSTQDAGSGHDLGCLGCHNKQR